jgi:hypothetical protein
MPKKRTQPGSDPVPPLHPNIEIARLDVREFDDRAVKYLLEAPENLRGIFRVLDEPIGDRLDFPRMQPMPTSLIPASLRSRNADLLVRVPFLSQELTVTSEAFVFVLAEHQSEPDPEAVFWLIAEMMLAWGKELRMGRKDRTKTPPLLSPVIPILLYTGDRPWDIPLSFESLIACPEIFGPFVPRNVFLTLNVPGESRDALARHPIGPVLNALSKGSDPEAELRPVLVGACERLQELKEKDRVAWERAITILNLLTYHHRAPEEGARLRRDVAEKFRDDEEVLAIMKTGADVLKEEGKKIGIEEGEKIGIEKGVRRMAGDLLKQKFGVLPERAESRLLTMDLARVQALALGVLSANSLDDLGL